MGLLNYTTEITVEKSIGEIQKMLIAAKATAILCDYDGAGNIMALSFKIVTNFGLMAFRLPAEISAVTRLLTLQSQAGKIPRKYAHDSNQARRVAWRILKDWIEAQLAIIETGMVTMEQVFLPYAQDHTGRTIFESLRENGFKTLALTDGRAKA
jgi:hypothetical protein